ALVAAAVARIAAGTAGGHTVAELADALQVSRRALERRFRVALGRTPLDEIHRQRIQRAQALLAGGAAVAATASACGFNDRQRFGAAFRSRTGMTPTGFRALARGEAPV
nr:helix-turn-helix domain-containing protein [Planctomycetota bacterium]